jgi:polyvinyl alcohol dehydrogenase (cytochrome)
VNLCAFSGFRVDRRDWERALRIRPVVQWGSAFDGSQVYVALADVAMLAPPPGGRGAQPTMLGIPLLLDPKAGGGLCALNPQSGAIVWKTPHPGCTDGLSCSPAQSAAASTTPSTA